VSLIKVKRAWEHIETWLQRNVPNFADILNIGATEEQLQSAERILGVVFPHDVQCSYTIHNGENCTGRSAKNGSGILGASEFYNLRQIIEVWQMWNDLLREHSSNDVVIEGYDGVKAVYWNTAWIPIMNTSSGNYICIDLDPAPNGKKGQIISFWTDIAEREVVFDSFTEMLEDYAEKLQNDEIVFSEEYGCLVHIDELSEEEWEKLNKE